MRFPGTELFRGIFGGGSKVVEPSAKEAVDQINARAAVEAGAAERARLAALEASKQRLQREATAPATQPTPNDKEIASLEEAADTIRRLMNSSDSTGPSRQADAARLAEIQNTLTELRNPQAQPQAGPQGAPQEKSAPQPSALSFETPPLSTVTPKPVEAGPTPPPTPSPLSTETPAPIVRPPSPPSPSKPLEPVGGKVR